MKTSNCMIMENINPETTTEENNSNTGMPTLTSQQTTKKQEPNRCQENVSETFSFDILNYTDHKLCIQAKA